MNFRGQRHSLAGSGGYRLKSLGMMVTSADGEIHGDLFLIISHLSAIAKKPSACVTPNFEARKVTYNSMQHPLGSFKARYNRSRCSCLLHVSMFVMCLNSLPSHSSLTIAYSGSSIALDVKSS